MISAVPSAGSTTACRPVVVVTMVQLWWRQIWSIQPWPGRVPLPETSASVEAEVAGVAFSGLAVVAGGRAHLDTVDRGVP